MKQTNVLMFVAGAALSASAVFAQNATLDQDRAYAAELVADAGSRTSLLANAGGAGYNDGMFQINDGTGNNTLNVGGSFAFRWNMSFRDDSVVGDQDDLTTGFNMPFARFRMSGNVWSKDLSYKLQGVANNEGGFGLEEAWARYDWGNGFAVRWGQFRLPLVREFNVDREFQLAMDRSVTGYAFDPGYVQGVEVQYVADMFRVMGTFSDGLSTANTDFNSSAEADYALTGRVEVQAMGNNWKRWDDQTSFKNAQDVGLLIGGGIHWQDGGETGGTTDTQILVYTLDASIEGQGWNAMAAFYGANVDSGGGDTDTFGGLIQGGIFVTDQVEVFGRWDALFLDDAGGSDDDSHFVTVGLNYYVSPESHAAKATVQVSYAFNETAGIINGVSSTGTDTGFLGQADDGEFTLNAQWISLW